MHPRIVVLMAKTATEHQVTALIARCYAGLDASGLRQEVLRRLRQMMSVDAAFFATTDPMTLLFTSAMADEPLHAATPLFLDNEFGRADVNKFARLAEAPDPVSSAWATSCAPHCWPRSPAGGCCACTGRMPHTASARASWTSSGASPRTWPRACGGPPPSA